MAHAAYDFTLDLAIRPNQNKSMLHVIWSVIVGFFVGLIARAIMPGAQHLTFIMTSLLGIGGSIVGGLIARLFYPVHYRRDHSALYLGKNRNMI